MRLHFSRERLDRLIEHVKKAPHHLAAFRQRKPIRPALWLVGDEGVYLRSNASPPLREEDGRIFVVYAAEVDPIRLDFDVWWQAKQASYGGDDGVDLIELARVEEALLSDTQEGPLVLDVSLEAVMLIGYGPPPRGAVAIDAEDRPVAKSKGGTRAH